jgi:hypothetical protein
VPYASKAKRLKYNRDYGKRNRKKLQTARNTNFREQPHKQLDRYLKATYGISFEQYAVQLYKQRGLCAICHLPCASGKRLAVDHDHATGELRGLLCLRCNISLAQFEKEGWPEAAEKYLHG